MRIRIDENKRLFPISPMLYGVFFEDINYGADGGLYGELLANRSFEYFGDSDDRHGMCWEPIGKTELRTFRGEPNGAQEWYAELCGTVRNTGFCGDGFAVRCGEKFRFRMLATGDADVCVRITDGETVLAEEHISINGSGDYAVSLTAAAGSGRAYLEISAAEKVITAFTSLFPEDTYKGRENGMRRDIAEMIADLKPAFMRFPGGCVVEGRSFEDMYRWKDTIGPIEHRRTNRNRWQLDEYHQEGGSAADYFQSYGLGFYEYFLFCEDVGAKPVPVINCGMTCQWHEGLTVERDRLGRWVDDAADLVEFANGPVTSEWGAKRAEMGHPEPFGLEYIGIGNEQWGNEYFERYEIFERELSRRCPGIRLIVSAGWNDSGPEFELAADWMKKNRNRAYAADEHFYKSPEWFIDNVSRYDGYDRSLPKVFIGEYAAHTDHDIPKRRCSWYAALSEAAFLTGVENNSDHVVMTCYAPLLARKDHWQWMPDLIIFDSGGVYGTPSYYVQKLFSENRGDTAVAAESDDGCVKLTASTVGDGEELIVKAVNISGEERETEIETAAEYASCEVTRLCAAPEDENSMAEPRKVYPFVSSCAPGGRYRLPAYSVNIFRLKK